MGKESSLMGHYRDVIIETYYSSGASSSHKIRARPCLGQGLDVHMNVECSSKMREHNPVGAKFLLQAKVTKREDGTPFLYAHFNAPYRVLTDQEARKYIVENNTKV